MGFYANVIKYSLILISNLMTQSHLTATKFSQLPLDATVLSGLTSANFEFCTPIQEKSLKLTLQGKDIAGQGQTGTGKTIAFLTATFDYLLKHPKTAINHNPRAIILTPVRDLVNQIYENASLLAQSTGLTLGRAYGGDDYEKQLSVINKGVDILIATPGRLIDYIKQNQFSLDDVQVLIIDEADRMFDEGFIKDIRWMLNRMPKPQNRFTMLFSATLSHSIRELAFEHMNEPEYIEVEPEQKIAHHIEEELFFPSNEDKMTLLQTLIEEEWPERAIIFTNTKMCAERIYRHLQADKHRVGLLTGDIAQNRRNKNIEQFTNGMIDILVATNVAARGLHIPNITHVFNYDLPDDYNDYLHRIGRTGRAGAKGRSISFACEKYAENLSAIEKAINHPIPISHYDSDALYRDFPKPKAGKPNNKRFRKPTHSNVKSRQ